VPQISSEDVYDPRNWENLNNKGQDILIEKGLVKELNLQFSSDANDRHFSYAYYTRKLSNGEEIDRKWLVYSSMSTKFIVFAANYSNQSKSLFSLRKW
jgi:hypothetical protein